MNNIINALTLINQLALASTINLLLIAITAIAFVCASYWVASIAVTFITNITIYITF